MTAPEQQQKELRKVMTRFGEVVALNEQDLRETLEKSFEEVSTVCRRSSTSICSRRVSAGR